MPATLTAYDAAGNICGWAKFVPATNRWLVRVNYGKPSAHCLRAKFQAQAEEMLRVHGATRIEAGEPAKT